MEAARVYKIKLGQNVLRQIVFTDLNCFLGFCVAMTFLIWRINESWSLEFKFLMSFCLCGISLLIFSIKIDRQSLLKIIPRIQSYLIRVKKIRN